MVYLRYILRLWMVAFVTGVTFQILGCATVVGKGDVSMLQGECSVGEDCSSYCCIVDKNTGATKQCRLKSQAIEGTSCTCPVTTIVGLRYLGGSVCKGIGDKSSTNSEATSIPARDYRPVDYKKWVSGLYADEFIGKAVVIDGYFQKSPMGSTSIMNMLGRMRSDMDFFIHEYSHDQIRQHSQKAGANSYSSSMEMVKSMIPVTAPKSMRDQIFEIKEQQKIRVYGIVINPMTSSSSLRVKAERIESFQ